MARLAALGAIGGALSLCACVTTSMQGYADRELPAQPVTHVAALVSAPLPLLESLQASIVEQGAKIGIVVDDARTIFPPTRQYTDAEIKHDLAAQGVGAVLIVTVGDSGVVREYAGTVFSGSYSGTATANFGGVTYGGTSTGFASPAYRFRRQTDFSARLVEVSSGRGLWVGTGQVSAGGALFVGNDTSATNTAASIFADMQTKGVIGPPQN
jgi:hypothetical protein